MPNKNDKKELGQFIPLPYHYNMLTDSARMQSFAEAISRVVPEGARVLELGGGTGVLSFFAAQKASKVWCVEYNPAMVKEARRILALNPHADNIEVVEGDAYSFLPPEPVDVVICEMLHVGMLREKQLSVINAFKQRYQEKFGPGLPIFIPEAFIQAVQPVQQDFEYYGFYAPTYFFQDPMSLQPKTKGLGDPVVYHVSAYADEYSETCSMRDTLTINADGELNALRVITKNILTILESEQRSVDWLNQYLIIPLPQSLRVRAGDKLEIEFSYVAGSRLEALVPQVRLLSKRETAQPEIVEISEPA